MDHNPDDESPKGFSFPMSKQEKQNHENLENNIKSIIDDDDDDVIVKSKFVKGTSPQIEVERLDNQDGNDEQTDVNKTDKQNLSPFENLNTLDKAAETNLKDSASIQNTKKLNILSNNYKPKGRVFKKGKLKKPQSQKEPSLNKPIGNFSKPSQFYYNKFADSNMALGSSITPIYDQECSSSSHVYSVHEHSTTSSAGESAGMYQKWDTYSVGSHQYIPPGYNMYQPNYYQAHPHPPPGLQQHQNIMPGGMNNPSYGHMYDMNHMHYQTFKNPQNSFMRSQTMMTPMMQQNCLQLDNQAMLYPGNLVQDSHKSPDNKSNRSPVKTKKGFRKVKSTNEKTTPIDPSARALISNCDRVSSVGEKLELLKGQLDLLIYNQSGSRFLQKLLTKANKEVIEFFLDEIDSSLNKLMMDKYGNYFCQELLLSCSGTQRLEILKKIQTNFIQVCKDKKGTHTIQKMVELVNLEEEEKYFMSALQGHVDYLAIDQQGTHIIQKVINCFTEQNRQFVFDEIKEGFLKISKTSHGLCVIKK